MRAVNKYSYLAKPVDKCLSSTFLHLYIFLGSLLDQIFFISIKLESWIPLWHNLPIFSLRLVLFTSFSKICFMFWNIRYRILVLPAWVIIRHSKPPIQWIKYISAGWFSSMRICRQSAARGFVNGAVYRAVLECARTFYFAVLLLLCSSSQELTN